MPRRCLVAFVAALAFHAAVALALGGPSDFDAWFHARFARGLVTGEIPADGGAFPWMTCNAWAAFPADWALGWHWLVAPFAALAEPVRGLAAAQVVCAAALTAAFHAALLRAEAPRPWLWTALLLLGCAGWLWRTHQARPTTAVVTLLIVLLVAVIEGRALLAAAAAAGATLLYALPTMPVVIGACACLGVLARDRRVPWRTGLAVLGGVAAALALHPGTWTVAESGPLAGERALLHLWKLIGGSIDFAARGGAVVADMGGGARAEFQVALPSELVAPRWPDFVAQLRVPLVATLAAVVVALRRRRDPWVVATAAAALVGLAMTHRSGRFFEYWHPFAALAAAMAWGRGGAVGGPAPAPRLVLAVAAIAVVAEVPGHVEGVRGNDPRLAASVAPAAAAIEARANPGDVVFHGSWDDFAPAAYHAPKARFLTGMDPWFFVAFDPALVAWHGAAVSGALDAEQLRQTIVGRFDARFVLLWRRPGREDRYDALERTLAGAPWAAEVHRDAVSTVFEMR